MAQTLIDMLNAGVTPGVPAEGSLGASGDLAPLAHIAAVLTRDAADSDCGDGDSTDADRGFSGQAWFEGELLTGAEAMARAGIKRLVLEAKEGLALSNGIDFMAAAGALAVHDAESLPGARADRRHAELRGAPGAHRGVRPPRSRKPAGGPGQRQVAARLLELVRGSQLVDSTSRARAGRL